MTNVYRETRARTFLCGTERYCHLLKFVRGLGLSGIWPVFIPRLAVVLIFFTHDQCVLHVTSCCLHKWISTQRLLSLCNKKLDKENIFL